MKKQGTKVGSEKEEKLQEPLKGVRKRVKVVEDGVKGKGERGKGGSLRRNRDFYFFMVVGGETEVNNADVSKAGRLQLYYSLSLTLPLSFWGRTHLSDEQESLSLNNSHRPSARTRESKAVE